MKKEVREPPHLEVSQVRKSEGLEKESDYRTEDWGVVTCVFEMGSTDKFLCTNRENEIQEILSCKEKRILEKSTNLYLKTVLSMRSFYNYYGKICCSKSSTISIKVNIEMRK